jgi:hypothetical protein
MEKKRTNSGPLMESTSKHSIYPPAWSLSRRYCKPHARLAHRATLTSYPEALGVDSLDLGLGKGFCPMHNLLLGQLLDILGSKSQHLREDVCRVLADRRCSAPDAARGERHLFVFVGLVVFYRKTYEPQGGERRL